jgi:glutathione reductase (NADPH)
MSRSYDLVAIGTGTAASVAAYRCRAAGWRVAVADHLPFGGTCALRGCDPKKVLVGAAEAIDHARRMSGKGVNGGPAIDWPALIAFKRSFTAPVPQQREEAFAKNGIDAFHGRARFRGPRTVEIEGEILEGRFILIATGAVPMPLGIAGEEHLATSTDFLELDRLPRRLVLVGGGYIAAEFSHIAARAGAEVTVLEQMDRVLPQFDPDLVGRLVAKSRSLGIELRLSTRVEAIERSPAGLRVVTKSARNKSGIEADLVVHAAGRVPDLGALDLGQAASRTRKDDSS